MDWPPNGFVHAPKSSFSSNRQFACSDRPISKSDFYFGQKEKFEYMMNMATSSFDDIHREIMVATDYVKVAGFLAGAQEGFRMKVQARDHPQATWDNVIATKMGKEGEEEEGYWKLEYD